MNIVGLGKFNVMTFLWCLISNVFGATIGVQNESTFQGNTIENVSQPIPNSPLQFVASTSAVLYHPDGLYNVDVRGMTCSCNLQLSNTERKADYQYSPGIGAHKLHTRGATFNEARKICIEEGGYLAVINSLDEQKVLLDLFNRSEAFINVSYDSRAFIGIHDYFEEGDWVTIFGDPIHKNGYVHWADGQPDNSGGAQQCGTLLKPSAGDGLDDVYCADRFAYFCEIPEMRIIT